MSFFCPPLKGRKQILRCSLSSRGTFQRSSLTSRPGLHSRRESRGTSTASLLGNGPNTSSTLEPAPRVLRSSDLEEQHCLPKWSKNRDQVREEAPCQDLMNSASIVGKVTQVLNAGKHFQRGSQSGQRNVNRSTKQQERLRRLQQNTKGWSAMKGPKARVAQQQRSRGGGILLLS